METPRKSLSETMVGWASGELCKHEIPHCATCKQQAGIRRNRDGELTFTGDCTVRTFMRLTGAEYPEAVDIMGRHGYRSTGGAPVRGLIAALEEVGYHTTSTGITLEAAAASGRTYFVHGWKGQRGHAWTIIDGQQSEAYRPPFRYRIYEVA